MMANTSAVYTRIDIGDMTRKQLDAALMKGLESIQSDKVYTADEVDAELKRRFGI